MTNPQGHVKDNWQQLQAFPIGAVEIICRIGVLPSEDHCQFQVEVLNAASREIIAMWSIPSSNTQRCHRDFRRMTQEALMQLESFVDPFPSAS